MNSERAPLQRYYGRYFVGNKEVALLELERAQEIANSQNRLYGHLTNILAAAAVAMLTLLVSEDYAPIWSPTVSGTRALVFWGTIVIFGTCILQYFAELQKTITLNARKAITLRRALGLDYSPLQLTLPAWRLEGANNPFAVSLFPGWVSLTTYPMWVVVAVVWGISYLAFRHLEFPIVGGSSGGVMIGAIVAFGNIVAFRERLSEQHETIGLRLAYVASNMLSTELLRDFSYILFRAKLAAAELKRVGIDTRNVKKMLVAIEDRRFFSHGGVCVRGLVRAALSRVAKVRERFGLGLSGGATIPMQLARTLLIKDYHKTVRRKLLELPLGIWLDGQFDKDDLLDLYVASVRFARGVFGLPSAVEYYFGGEKEELSEVEAFFLVERLSNSRPVYRARKIKAQLRGVNEIVDEPICVDSVERLYARMIRDGKLEGGKE